jgi:hypothetical protein
MNAECPSCRLFNEFYVWQRLRRNQLQKCIPTAETQPQLQPALLGLSAIISQYFPRGGFCLFYSPHGNHRMMLPLDLPDSAS